MAYNTANEPLSESFSGGTLSGLSVTNGYDQYLRRSQLAALNSTTPFLQHSFSFDNASRLLTVTDNTGSPAYSATYIYLAKSPLVSQIVFKQGTTTRMTTAKQHDYLNRLTSISSAVGSSAIGNSYACNNANQRIRSTLADGSYWLYEYDSLGQVRSGRKYWPDQTPVAGQQFEYTHDDIGNRTATKAGGDQNGANLRSASYLANNLNQYTNRTVPGAVDVMGVSFATNAVTVNGQTAYRKGEYFRKEIPVSNGSVPVWQSITNAATGQASITGNVFVPKTPEPFYYDADGNLTNDGCWRYAWDAENRLVTLTTNTAVGPRQSLKFEYDWQGRRIRKQVWSNASWNGTPTNDVKFVYDGWNLLAELNATNSAVIRSFMWGSDLPGTSQGAGGVGGLLKVAYSGAQTTNCFVAFDGNGNVAALADAASTNILAQYEYSPFGEVIRATGPMAKANPFRFSTKYQDDETDLLYYGYRYYNPSTGKWNSRDPLEEAGGFNLYGMVRNNAVNRIDRLGLDDGDSFFMMFIEFLTHTGDSTFTGYSDSIWNSILEHEEVLNLYTKVMSEATHMRTCCKTSRKKIPGGNLIFRESFFRWGSWGGFNAGVAIGTGTLDVGTIPLVVKCDDKQCSWRADFMFTLKDKYSFRSYDDSGVEHPWYTIEDNNWVLRYFSPTIFLIIGKDFDIADKRFLTKTGTFPCHRN
jgi:RHS repeat-associated protein